MKPSIIPVAWACEGSRIAMPRSLYPSVRFFAAAFSVSLLPCFLFLFLFGMGVVFVGLSPCLCVCVLGHRADISGLWVYVVDSMGREYNDIQ